jgi:hypothetical protein
MAKTMNLRIVTYVNPLLGRRWHVEREYAGICIFGYRMTGGWRDVSGGIGNLTEAKAKEFAEDYAMGSWVSDSATFTIEE